MDLILHPTTKTQVAQFLEQPNHAVLLVGANGVGKTTLATKLAAGALGMTEDELMTHPYYTLLRSDGDSISIETIRDLQRFMQLKTIGTKPLRRAAIIEHADRLTTEAQNAFLKLLEEPPADTIMILTTDNQRALLPTIRSRVQTIAAYAPDETDLKTHFRAKHVDEQTLNQAYFLSGGLPGLMHALLEGDETHPLAAAVGTAKTLLGAPLFERLAQVDSLSKQKDAARYTVEALQHIAQTGLNQAAAKGDANKIKQWHHILKVSAEANQAFSQSANPKLVLSNLMLHI